MKGLLRHVGAYLGDVVGEAVIRADERVEAALHRRQADRARRIAHAATRPRDPFLVHDQLHDGGDPS